ncbi:MAG: glycosyltransferase [Dysgonamonadaceae bacterium]|jgi:glycosyltransferase involved in cell wall biosynthesis|nr:glycosyltransferase [Dysgonamonadaceae bacterium]
MAYQTQQKQCVVVFPIYRKILNDERDCLKQAIRMTSDFPHVFIAPESLEIDESFCESWSIPVVRFKNEYFSNIAGYNELMLSLEFYQTFSAYEYILIHQTDVYLFKPELEAWCNKGYDYIGAPWYKPYKRKKVVWDKFLLSVFPFFISRNRKNRYARRNEVGNGGLSLRRTSTFIEVIQKAPKSLLFLYKSNPKHLFNEDIFWSLLAPRILKTFKKPSWEEALRFAFETYPEEAYRKIGKQLPFGCHAFNVHGRKFWEQFIPVRMRKHLLIDLYALSNPTCGFGQISLNYERHFGPMYLDDMEFIFLVPDAYQGNFGRKYLPLRNFNRTHDNFSGIDLFHITNQQRTYRKLPTEIPIVFTIHDLNFLYEKSPLKIKKYLHKVGNLVNQATVIVAISHFVANEIRKNFNLNGKQLKVIYNGVERIDEAPDAKPAFVKDVNRPFFFTIGQVRTKKNFHVLLDVLKAFPEYDLYICGEDQRTYAKTIRQQIANESIHNVFLPGTISNEERVWLYRNCQAFLFPSKYEGFGLPVLEAMQFGKAVFSSPMTSLTEICGGHAFLWEDDFNPSKMIRLIQDELPGFYQNKERIEEMKTYAFSFSYEKHIRQYLELYQELLR